jgi:hypothetical protein
MKMKILGGTALLAIAAVAVFNVNLSSKSNDLSAISIANVEALAGEGGTTITTCLGLWGSCTTSSGASAKAPLVEASF